jgi:hypothetical protein
MTREIRNKPHPTPNPDGLHAISGNRTAGAGAGRPSQPDDEPAGDEPNYDSCTDDLNLILSTPLPEPDPVLKSLSSSDTIPRVSQESASLPSFLQERGTQPRTSEIFQGLGPQTVDAPQQALRAAKQPGSLLTENSPDPDTVFEGRIVATGQSTDRETGISESASDDDHLAETRLPWTLLLFMSYSSAVTLALTWVLWTGRSFRSAETPPASAPATEVESVARTGDAAALAPLPPLPAANVVKLGETVRLGDLEATPLEIRKKSLQLVRSIEPSKWRREKSPALVLRLRLKNISADQTFAPMESRFLREQTAAVDRSSIVTSQGKSINLFPLAVDSEWSIVGQEFSSLEPGESVETIIASEPGAADQLSDDTTWRVRVRTGPYRTDVLGVRFNKSDVMH